jgi:cephalosporin hydroxylase
MSLTELYTELYNSSILDSNFTDYRNSDKGTCHSYIPHLYNEILEPYREKPVNVLELGIFGGTCLLLWEKYFINAKQIVGVDIDLSYLQPKVVQEALQNKKIKIIQHDVTKESLTSVLNEKYDVIIDDASHQIPYQLISFKLLENSLNDGGIYIIEDIQSDENAKFLTSNIPNSKIVDLRHVKNRYDDLVLVYKK